MLVRIILVVLLLCGTIYVSWLLLHRPKKSLMQRLQEIPNAVLVHIPCRLQAEWAPLWETSGYHLSGCGADCSTTLGIKPVRRLDSRPLRDCRADQGRIDSLSGPGPMFR